MARAVYHYGAKEDTYDFRDHEKEYHSSEIPRHPNIDLRGYVDHISYQGSLGSCTANALCAAYGLDLKKQAQTLSTGGYYYFDPSRLFLYYNTREYEGTTHRDAGASIRDTVKALNRKGVCPEKDWPYYIKNFTHKPSDKCYQAASGNNLCKYQRLTQNKDQLRACLNDKCPFVFGFNVYRSFHNYSIKTSGEMSMPSRDEIHGGPEGRHAVVAVGYDDAKKCFIIQNSWGKDWGDRGYFYMPYAFITDSRMCSDFWKITFACERGKPPPKGTHTGATGFGSGGGGRGGKAYYL